MIIKEAVAGLRSRGLQYGSVYHLGCQRATEPRDFGAIPRNEEGKVIHIFKAFEAHVGLAHSCPRLLSHLLEEASSPECSILNR